MENDEAQAVQTLQKVTDMCLDDYLTPTWHLPPFPCPPSLLASALHSPVPPLT